MEGYYETLDLNNGASLSDIRRAFRRLAKRFHPDTSGSGDAVRFQKIYGAYRALLRQLGGTAESSRPEVKSSEATGESWRFEGVADDGANVIYLLRVTPEASLSGLRLTLPWKKEDACPRCLGAGHTFAMHEDGDFRKRPCPKCEGRGVSASNATLRVEVTPELIQRGRIRLRGAGHYRPGEALRGDLIIQLEAASGGLMGRGFWAS